MQGTQVQFLVGELKFYVPSAPPKKPLFKKNHLCFFYCGQSGLPICLFYLSDPNFRRLFHPYPNSCRSMAELLFSALEGVALLLFVLFCPCYTHPTVCRGLVLLLTFPPNRPQNAWTETRMSRTSQYERVEGNDVHPWWVQETRLTSQETWVPHAILLLDSSLPFWATQQTYMDCLLPHTTSSKLSSTQPDKCRFKSPDLILLLSSSKSFVCRRNSKIFYLIFQLLIWSLHFDIASLLL